MRPYRNRGLFSSYYLDELLPKEDEFKIPISEVKGVFEKVKGIWDRSRFEAINEDQLRKHFLDNVLDYLGWVVDVNAPVPTGEWSKRPDYAFFLNNESLKTAQKGKKDDYFKRVTCIAEAKRLGRPLDKKLKTEADPFEVQNPSLQISRYLWLTGVKWGILTDGKYWRLYERETSKRLDIFYEVDLENLIESGFPEDFRYFYLLFGKDAFPEFIEKVYKGSVDYAQEVGEGLKENIYQALKTLAQGFLKTSGNNLSKKNLKEIHDNSLILLYRLLFILYAEHRDLLPLGVNRLYTESYSLDAFKKEVASRLDKNEPIATSTFGYWNKLKELFEIINIGNKELGVPPYNGGLFDSEKHHFLEKYRIGDLYVAKAIDLLSRSRDKAYIDYGSLEIRHLGSIYEGLLEYELKIADQDRIPIKVKDREVFVSLEEAKKQKKKIREDEKIQTGEIYLVTDKGERKATGSYYTPDYIVKYIVENTLGPLVEEKRKKLLEKVGGLKDKIKGARGASREFYEKELKKAEGSLIDEILSLKVLDPAMGSGHFLVEATDFLARELLKVLSGEPLEVHPKGMVISEPSVPYGLKETEDEDIRWARREVVERCIFGVDLNPMAVELSKLSLWLYTVAKDRPLNFLDHHLRCGNSLIGAKIDDLANPPEVKKKKVEGESTQLGLFESIFKEKVNILLGAFAQIEMLPSDTVEQIREKEKLYQDFRIIVSRFQDVADIWDSVYFGNDVESGNYQKLQNRLRSTDEEWGRLGQESWFKKAKETSNRKRFYHWELEFPEIFFEGHQRKENPGFDAVIGNPPYLAVDSLDTEERRYFPQKYSFLHRKYDLMAIFLSFVRTHCCQSGRLGMIVPQIWESGVNYSRFRIEILGSHAQIERLVNLPFDVFREAYVDTSVVIFKHIFPIVDQYEFLYKVYGKYDSAEELIIAAHSLATLRLIDVKAGTAVVVGEASPLLKMLFDERLYIRLGKLIKCCQGPVESFLSLGKELRKGERTGQTYAVVELDRYDCRLISRRIIMGFPEESYREFYQPPRILVRRILSRQDRLLFGLVTEPFVCKKDFNPIVLSDPVYSLHFLLAILNSRLISKLYVTRSAISLKDDFRQTTLAELINLQIRCISFTTSKIERIAALEKGKTVYKKSLTINDLLWVPAFVDHCLKQNPERSDLVHDILAFLAEQMIEMNKEKQGEIEGFLKWLESQLKFQSDSEGSAGIEVLTGKTQIKNYLGDYQKREEHSRFEDFWKILEKNKTRIQTNLKSRELFENVKSEYEKSLSKVLPLKEKLRNTDWLIDQIVYKLYGLTEEEIKIVESHS